MWRVSGEYAFLAHARGATAVTGIDVAPATAAFRARNAEMGDPVRFLQGDVNDPTLRDRAGEFDVVFCSGVLYHLPDPIFSLTQLRSICRERLILTTASTVELDVPHAAILLPFLSDAERKRLTHRSGAGRKVGLDTPFDGDKGYGNWFWLPTPSCVAAMVRLAGFEVEALHARRRVTTVVAAPRARAG
jgi:SAM-dependent methyltransferase